MHVVLREDDHRPDEREHEVVGADAPVPEGLVLHAQKPVVEGEEDRGGQRQASAEEGLVVEISLPFVDDGMETIHAAAFRGVLGVVYLLLRCYRSPRSSLRRFTSIIAATIVLASVAAGRLSQRPFNPRGLSNTRAASGAMSTEKREKADAGLGRSMAV